MSTSALAVERLTVTLGMFTLRSVSFSLAPGETLVVLGANGAGKSVLLETIAGFHRLREGRVLVGTRDVTHRPPEARSLGYVPQSFALFPHLSVTENVRFGAVTNGRELESLLERFDLTRLADRQPSDLSGGEKQRVALARALAAKPSVFLFDEPFSALDAVMRETLREDLREFLRASGIATLYVTHDHAEALALAHRVAVVDAGAIVQIDCAQTVFSKPANAGVARLTGVGNLLAGEVRHLNGAELELTLGPQRLVLSRVDGRMALTGRVDVCIRGEDITLAARGAVANRGVHALPATVQRLADLGPVLRASCECGVPIATYVTKPQARALALAAGAEVTLLVPDEAIHLLA